MTPLPTIPSELLAVALQDFKSCMEQGWKPNLSYWVVGNNGKPCTVCLAGAVMVKTCDSIGEYIPKLLYPSDLLIPKEEQKKLFLINELRLGYVNGVQFAKPISGGFVGEIIKQVEDRIQTLKDMGL